MDMYAKLFSRITESSLMEEPIDVRYTFVLLLAIADPKGYVIGTDIALARRLNMEIEQFKSCVESLRKPDPDSNSKDEEGMRLVESDGERGYRIVNFPKYRDMVDEDHRREYMRNYMRSYREGKPSVNNGKQPLAQEDESESVNADAKEDPPKEGAGGKSGFTEGKDSRLLPTTPQSQRIAALFNRRLTTAWSEPEVKAYRKLGQIADADLDLIERYYASQRAKGDDGVHRRDLGTFLNNFPGELDRARAAVAPRTERQTAKVDPEGWRDWLKEQGAEYRPFANSVPGTQRAFENRAASSRAVPSP